MTETTRELDAEEKLRRIGRWIDRLVEKVQVSETTEALQSGVAKELKRIDEHRAATHAQIAQDLATTRKDLSRAFGEELDVWKARLGELEVQATLGRMEARDRLEPFMERIDLLIDRIRKDVEELAHAEVIDEEDLANHVQTSMNELRREIDAAEELPRGEE